MNKTVAIELSEYAKELEARYSRTDREGNFSNETFSLKEIIPTSEHTATLIFQKTSGKLAAFFCYYIQRGMAKGWKYFVPTDSHITGMRAFEYYKLQVERNNYKKNFAN